MALKKKKYKPHQHLAALNTHKCITFTLAHIYTWIIFTFPRVVCTKKRTLYNLFNLQEAQLCFGATVLHPEQIVLNLCRGQMKSQDYQGIVEQNLWPRVTMHSLSCHSKILWHQIILKWVTHIVVVYSPDFCAPTQSWCECKSESLSVSMCALRLTRNRFRVLSAFHLKSAQIGSDSSAPWTV